MPAWNYILRGGWLVDGTGAEPAVGDLAVEDQFLDAVGELPPASPDDTAAVKVLDCSGLAVAPGFIDVHTHSDMSLLGAPEADTHVAQGVTTNICGNCGESAFPASGPGAQRLLESGERYGLKGDWGDLPGFLKQVEKRPSAVNRGLLVGHGAVRASVMGYGDHAPTDEELAAMRDEIRKAMDLGCLGFSTGLIYPPGMYSRVEEIVELAKAAAAGGGIYASHIRGEGKNLEAAVKEFLRVGREASIPLQLSHLKVSGQENWDKIDWLLETLEKARSRGRRLTADRYPYTASETSLDVLLPAWAFDGGHDKEMERLKGKATRARLAREISEANPDPEFWKRVVVGSVREKSLKDLSGRSVAEIAGERGKPALDTYLDILVEDDARTYAMYHKLSEEHLERIIQLPWVMIGSDSSARGTTGPTAAGHPHPRGAGSFARILARYVREKKVLSLAEAVHKMTGLPASTFGLAKHGRLEAGCYADLVVFDPEKIADRASYRTPKKLAEGVVHVFVNGRPVMLGGKRTDERPGRLLRREDGK